MVKNNITFEGIPGGDCECFCWFVNKATYQKITGEKPHVGIDKRGPYYLLYPDHVMYGLGIGNAKKKVKFTISIEKAGK